MQSGTHILSLYALTTSFSLGIVRVRLRHFAPALNEYRGFQTFALEDRYGNFSGAVVLHGMSTKEQAQLRTLMH